MSILLESVKGDAWLVTISGRLDQHQTPELEARLQELLDTGQSRIIVDMSQVSYVNSGGLRCLVTIWRQARSMGGTVALCDLSDRVAEVINIVGFNKIFQVFPSAERAQLAFENE